VARGSPHCTTSRSCAMLGAGGAEMTTPAAFSHFGIHVTDLARMEEFYTRVVGLLVTDRGPLRDDGPTLVFLSHDPDEHHQMVLVPRRPPRPEYNAAHPS